MMAISNFARPAVAFLVLGAVGCSTPPAPEKAAGPAQPGQVSTYLTPPQTAKDVLVAPPVPQVVVSPSRETVALIETLAMPPIAKLARPMLKLAGFRINPATNGPHTTPDITSIVLKKAADGAEVKLALPAGAEVVTARFTPDGKRFACTLATDKGIQLWVADVATGQGRMASETAMIAAWGEPCDWRDDGASVLCKTVPAGRGAVPAPPAVPQGPNVQESDGTRAPVRTNQNMLTSAHDEALFEHYFTAQLALVDVTSGRLSTVGAPGLFEEVQLSPDGEFVLVVRVKRPFSRLVPAAEFPKTIEVWNSRGELVRAIGEAPLAESVPINGVRTGPRAYRWLPSDPSTLVWVEALDKGDPTVKIAHRDRVVSLKAPFSGEPAELARTEYRFQSIAWTDKGIGLLTENDRERRWTRTWIVERSAAARKLWDLSLEDRYALPGVPVMRPYGLPTAEFRPSLDRVVLQHGDAIYLSGEGASPAGDHPFLDRLDLKSLATQRLFSSPADSYESVVAVLADDGSSLLTRRETETTPPNLAVIGSGGSRRELTSFANPIPQFAGHTKQLITYQRPDGVALSATLYLPAGYKPGERLPMMVWAYPREFTDPKAASQVVGSPHRFPVVNFGSMHLLFLTAGYAVLDGPTMPIVGPGETANDSYVEQLVASAKAAVDKVVAMGVADPDRIGVGGHSYGAFMTANLLTHSDLFRAGVALSGAYNRSLTPFTFQNERRTFWEVPHIYARMSPFWYAHVMNEPLLLIHGEADNNQGTFPIQSERYYMALKGHGAAVRYVTLPFESHRYAAAESILDVVAEMFNWFDKHVKGAPPRPPAKAATR